MRRLSLLRHAKADSDDPSVDDFYRPLSGRGRRSAEAMGRYLADYGASFDLILASPAQRVGETLKGLAEGGWRGGAARFERSIYLAGAQDLLAMAKDVPDTVQSLLLVGHNPAIGVLASLLAREDGSAMRAALSSKYPTGTLAELELDVPGWKDIAPGCGRLTAFVTPRSLGVA